MRGTNYKVGFSIGAFFFLAGIGFYVLGSKGVFASAVGLPQAGAADSTFRLIGIIWAGVAVFLLFLFSALGLRGTARRALAISGVEGTALVQEAESTNAYINGMPQFRLKVELQRSDGGPTLTCTKRDIVPLTAMGRWGIGTALPVRISRRDPDDFEILWDDLPAPASNADVADELSKLAELVERGLLSAEEWERAKQLYLGKPVDQREADTRLLRELNDLFRTACCRSRSSTTRSGRSSRGPEPARPMRGRWWSVPCLSDIRPIDRRHRWVRQAGPLVRCSQGSGARSAPALRDRRRGLRRGAT